MTQTPQRPRRGSLATLPRTSITRSVQRPRTRAGIAGIGSWVPERIVTTAELETRVNEASAPHGVLLKPGLVEKLTGVRERRHKAASDDASDLAVRAARVALEQAGLAPTDVDLIIFASTSQDLIEPATSHIVCDKLGATGMAFDVKNACNSFLNGVQVADALIRSHQYERVLVCTGEAPSDAIRWEARTEQELRGAIASYTLGDAGAAVVLEAQQDGRGIDQIQCVAASEHWQACTVRAGGSMHGIDPEHGFFTSDGSALRDAFVDVGPALLMDMFGRSGTTFDDYDAVVFHQVTVPFLDLFMEVSGVPRSRIVSTIDTLGNVASATMPLQLHRMLQEGVVEAGSRVLWIGLGAGISLGVMTMRL